MRDIFQTLRPMEMITTLATHHWQTLVTFTIHIFDHNHIGLCFVPWHVKKLVIFKAWWCKDVRMQDNCITRSPAVLEVWLGMASHKGKNYIHYLKVKSWRNTWHHGLSMTMVWLYLMIWTWRVRSMLMFQLAISHVTWHVICYAPCLCVQVTSENLEDWFTCVLNLRC